VEKGRGGTNTIFSETNGEVTKKRKPGDRVSAKRKEGTIRKYRTFVSLDAEGKRGAQHERQDHLHGCRAKRQKGKELAIISRPSLAVKKREGEAKTGDHRTGEGGEGKAAKEEKKRERA